MISELYVYLCCVIPLIMKENTLTIQDENYKSWLKDIKTYIRSQQIKAAVKVNVELLKVYWRLGSDISVHKTDAQWGSGFYESLSRDLKAEFPDMKGFSVTNLKYCKRFYELYNQSDIIRHQVGDELDVPIFSIPWRHHTEISSIVYRWANRISRAACLPLKK